MVDYLAHILLIRYCPSAAPIVGGAVVEKLARLGAIHFPAVTHVVGDIGDLVLEKR